MLGRMVAKLLFKACVPMVAMAGVMTYGVYLKGGDPGSLWKHVASGAFGKAGAMFSKAKDDAVGLAGNLTGEGGVSGALTSGSATTEVFTWKDAEGVTHFGTTPPVGISTTTVRVDPNVNVVAPVEAPEEIRLDEADTRVGALQGLGMPGGGRSQSAGNTSRSTGGRQVNQSVQELEEQLGGPLPGVAGQVLSSGGGGNGVDPTQLIRMLQSAGN